MLYEYIRCTAVKITRYRCTRAEITAAVFNVYSQGLPFALDTLHVTLYLLYSMYYLSYVELAVRGISRIKQNESRQKVLQEQNILTFPPFYTLK